MPTLCMIVPSGLGGVKSGRWKEVGGRQGFSPSDATQWLAVSHYVNRLAWATATRYLTRRVT